MPTLKAVDRPKMSITAPTLGLFVLSQIFLNSRFQTSKRIFSKNSKFRFLPKISKICIFDQNGLNRGFYEFQKSKNLDALRTVQDCPIDFKSISISQLEHSQQKDGSKMTKLTFHVWTSGVTKIKETLDLQSGIQQKDKNPDFFDFSFFHKIHRHHFNHLFEYVFFVALSWSSYLLSTSAKV